MLCRYCTLLTVQEQQQAGGVTPVLYIADGTRATTGRLCYAGTVHCWRYKSSNGQAVVRRYCTLLMVQEQQWAGCYTGTVHCWRYKSSNGQAVLCRYVHFWWYKNSNGQAVLRRYVHFWWYKGSNGQAVLRRYCTLLTVQEQQWAGCIHVASCWCDPSQNQ
jgi:hypothetical protein